MDILLQIISIIDILYLRYHRYILSHPHSQNLTFPAEKKHIFYHSKNSEQAGVLDFTYYSAVRSVENALS